MKVYTNMKLFSPMKGRFSYNTAGRSSSPTPQVSGHALRPQTMNGREHSNVRFLFHKRYKGFSNELGYKER